MYILGISAYYHYSAAALIHNGEIVAAAQEERFTRKKHDAGFPREAILYCLNEAGISLSDVECLTFYDKPFVKFERLLETYFAYAPSGFMSFVKAMPIWLKEKIFLKNSIRKELKELSGLKKLKLKLLFTEHHQSHASSCFFPSPYEEAAVLCMDGVGEWATTTLWVGKGNKLDLQWSINFPHSLGLIYSAFTYYTGFKVNSGEYKLMGLAPYGEPKYADLIKKHLIDVKDDGTFRLDMSYFNYAAGLTMTSEKFHKLFGEKPRKPESEITQREMDLARSIQYVIEEIVQKIAIAARKETGIDNLCLAGGVALNCVSNGKLTKEKIFKNVWVQPAAGDAGGALGAAYSAWYEYYGKSRGVDSGKMDSMRGSYLGPAYDNEYISSELSKLNAVFVQDTDDALFDKLADILKNEKVVGWFAGRMEFGPRALGGRSIIGDPRSTKMQSVMNLKIKYRESFRPFAPAVLDEDVSKYFEFDEPSPYMLQVASVQKDLWTERSNDDKDSFGIDKINQVRSKIPAVTHVDHSARIQTVHKETNPRFYDLLKAFKSKTDCSVLINTSFNVRGEPIVQSVEDAYKCFMRTEMDCLVVENCILLKEDQPAIQKDESWMKEYELD